MSATKKRKPSMNISLHPDARKIAKEIMRRDHRVSTVNVLEHLLYAEADRSGIRYKKAVAK